MLWSARISWRGHRSRFFCGIALVVAGCTPTASPIAASGAYPYAATIRPSFERVDVLVTITNRSPDVLSGLMVFDGRKA
jgi:hypothetical protein